MTIYMNRQRLSGEQFFGKKVQNIKKQVMVRSIHNEKKFYIFNFSIKIGIITG